MTREDLRIPARELRPGDVLLSHNATINEVDVVTSPGAVFVEVDYTFRLTYNHGEPVEVSREVVA